MLQDLLKVSRERVFFSCVLILAIAVLWTFLLPLAVGMTFAALSDTMNDRIERAITPLTRRLRLEATTSRYLAATLFVSAICIIFVLPLIAALSTAVGDAYLIVKDWSTNVELIQTFDTTVGRLQLLFDNWRLPLRVDDLWPRLKSVGEAFGSKALQVTGDLLAATPKALVELTLIMASWIYFGVHGRRWRARIIPVIFPWEEERNVVTETTRKVLQALIVSSIVISVAQAVSVTFFMLIAGIPRAIVWGLLTFFVSFIPVVGTAPITLGALIYGLSQGDYWAAGVMLTAAFVAGTVDNFLRPYVMKDSLDLSFFWLLLAFLGGVASFGITGTVIGPLALSLFIGGLRGLEMKKQLVQKED